MTQVRTLTVAPEEADLRLDRWFKRHFPELGHGRLEKLLRTGQVRLDGKRASAGDRLTPGQVVRVPPLPAVTPDASPRKSRAQFVTDEREAASLRRLVLHHDDDVIAIDKPAGLAVQGGSGTTRHPRGMRDGQGLEGAEPAPLVPPRRQAPRRVW